MPNIQMLMVPLQSLHGLTIHHHWSSSCFDLAVPRSRRRGTMTHTQSVGSHEIFEALVGRNETTFLVAQSEAYLPVL